MLAAAVSDSTEDMDGPVVVSFNQSTYSVSENGLVQPVLVLSSSSKTDIIVQVTNTNGTAFGE